MDELDQENVDFLVYELKSRKEHPVADTFLKVFRYFNPARLPEYEAALKKWHTQTKRREYVAQYNFGYFYQMHLDYLPAEYKQKAFECFIKAALLEWSEPALVELGKNLFQNERNARIKQLESGIDRETAEVKYELGFLYSCILENGQ